MDRSRLLALGVLGLVLPLAGCFGGKDGSEDEGVDPAVDAPAPGSPVATGGAADGSFDAPVWTVGDAWAISPVGDAGQPGVLVVTGAEGDAYTLATTDPDAAGYDALFDISYLGRIRASDLAGHQGGKPVQFFSFPLADDKTWTTTWDGLEIKLAAKWNPALTTSAGIHPGFEIVGTYEGEPYVRYDYVPTLKWWSHLSFANGYGMKVERTFADWTGEYVAAEAKKLVESAPAPSVTFTVEEGASFVHVTLQGESTQYARAWRIFAPDGTPHDQQTETGSAGSGDVSITERLPPTPGEWRIVSPVVNADGGFTLKVNQVTLTTLTLA